MSKHLSSSLPLWIRNLLLKLHTKLSGKQLRQGEKPNYFDTTKKKKKEKRTENLIDHSPDGAFQGK